VGLEGVYINSRYSNSWLMRINTRFSCLQRSFDSQLHCLLVPS
jgi:hypothetical protein